MGRPGYSLGHMVEVCAVVRPRSCSREKLSAGALWAGAIARWSNSAVVDPLQPWSNISASSIRVGRTLPSSLLSLLSLELVVVGIRATGAWNRRSPEHRAIVPGKRSARVCIGVEVLAVVGSRNCGSDRIWRWLIGDR
jgi:hypothetical protein